MRHASPAPPRHCQPRRRRQPPPPGRRRPKERCANRLKPRANRFPELRERSEGSPNRFSSRGGRLWVGIGSPTGWVPGAPRARQPVAIRCKGEQVLYGWIWDAVQHLPKRSDSAVVGRRQYCSLDVLPNFATTGCQQICSRPAVPFGECSFFCCSSHLFPERAGAGALSRGRVAPPEPPAPTVELKELKRSPKKPDHDGG